MEAERYDASMAGYERSAIRIWTSLGFLNFGQALIFYAGFLIISVMAINGVINKTLTLGDFVLLNTFLMQVYRPLNFIGFVYRELRQGLTDIEEMFKLLDQNPEIEDKLDAVPLAITGPVIRFDNVTFHYDPDRPILKGVSFEVPAGKTVAIVGPTGAGKSTISRLLYRFYDVTGGAITIDGHGPARHHPGKPAQGHRHGPPGQPCCSTTASATTSNTATPAPAPRRSARAAAMAQVGPLHRGAAQGLRHPRR